MIVKTTRAQLFDWIMAGLVELELADIPAGKVPPGEPTEGLGPDSIVLVELPDKYGRGSTSGAGVFALVDEVRAISAATAGLTRELGAQLRNLGEGWLPVAFRADWFGSHADVAPVAPIVETPPEQAQVAVLVAPMADLSPEQAHEAVPAQPIADEPPALAQEAAPNTETDSEVAAANAAMPDQGVLATAESAQNEVGAVPRPVAPPPVIDPPSPKPKVPKRARSVAGESAAPKIRASRKKASDTPALLPGEGEKK